MLHNIARLEIACICWIFWLRYKWRLCILKIVPINWFEEHHLLHFFGWWPIIWIHGQKLFDGINGFGWKRLIGLIPLDIWKVVQNTSQNSNYDPIQMAFKVIFPFVCFNVLRFKIFSNTCCGVSSLNGGMPVINSKRQTPSDHQSTAAPCFWLKERENFNNSQVIERFEPYKLIWNTYERRSSGLK